MDRLAGHGWLLSLSVLIVGCDDEIAGGPDFGPTSIHCDGIAPGKFASPTQWLPDHEQRELFALGRWSGGGLAPSRASALLFLPLSGDETISLTQPSGATLRLMGEGSLAGTTWGRCDAMGGIVLVVQADEPGAGSLTLRDGDEIRWSTEIAVAVPAAMTLSLDEDRQLVEASLTNSSGLPIYAGDIVWQAAPTIDVRTESQGNQLVLVNASEQPEIRVDATFGELRSSIALVRAPSGAFVVAPD